LPDGRTVTVADFKNISIRCPLELVRAVEALLARRTAENPYQIPSVGSVYRELLARGLESLAADAAAEKSGRK
jgi:UDP-N-acetylenolpyruvoylglucosamine reductase